MKSMGLVLLSILVVLGSFGFAHAQIPKEGSSSYIIGPVASNAETAKKCEQNNDRALVLSGGGAKGAFEAGAIFHFIKHRDCDFRDIAGVSVGALNGAYIAEAASDENSLGNLQVRTQGLINFWRSINGPDDILRPRFFGTLGLLLFGLDSLNDFTPLERKIRDMRPTKIRESKRSLRVGTVSFYNGVYREIDPNQVLDDDKFRKYVLASASIPIYTRLPIIRSSTSDSGHELEIQFADGGVSHTTPLAAYFSPCDFSKERLVHDVKQFGRVTPCVVSGLQEHSGPIKELFVVVANPYDPALASLETEQTVMSDGRKILERTLDVLTTSTYRWDLNFALAANRMLKWRKEVYDWAKSVAQQDKAREVLGIMGQGILSETEFPVRSANPGPEGFSLPYKMVIVAPAKVYADTYGFDKANIRLQLYKGCIHADLMMVREFGMESMRDACKLEFPIDADQLSDDPDPPL
jgi:predicted acylesterase/phospholipase RssA